MRLTGLAARAAEPTAGRESELTAAQASSNAMGDSAEPPPVRVDRERQGRLVVASQDPRAVELIQQLFAQNKPRGNGFHVFRMKNKTSWAMTIADNLRQFFRGTSQGRRETQTPSRQSPAGSTPRGASGSRLPGATPRRHSKNCRNPPKFIVDDESNSILAVEADAEQIRTAQQLIELYDTPEAQESPVVRTTRLVPVRFGNPKQVCETLKEVYKDLLATSTDAPSTGRKKHHDRTNLHPGGREGENGERDAAAVQGAVGDRRRREFVEHRDLGAVGAGRNGRRDGDRSR